ncbi:MAG: glycoside hydrolase family 2 protein [Lachnospiraceae bacterium]|nr:glycoside hydrolase family 2 protein [Lachnospiraceae bacterium]
MGNRVYLNNGWKFYPQFEEAYVKGNFSGATPYEVRIPHTVKELPFHYFDESEYQMVSAYAKSFTAPKEWEGKVILLTFDAVAHDCSVYVNGEKIGEHHSGYTAFTLDISEALKYGEENLLVARVDSRESLNVPPFGFVIDYMTYGGIYRDVYLTVKEPSYIKDVFVTFKLAERFGGEGKEPEQGPKTLHCHSSKTLSRIEIAGAGTDSILRQWIRKKGEKDYTLLGEVATTPVETGACELAFSVGEVELWDIENPVLYEMRTELADGNGCVYDEVVTTIGFRKAVFKKNGFFLNGRKVRIRGLNRHQSYAYTGYAMPDSMQVLDARILKRELGVNAVRTSHYPQAHSFLDACDELGLLVFTEFPGWQHIGDDAWKEQAVENVKEMITQYRNHPSIILWGVRINESVDDDAFYERTNKVAHMMDPSRQTGGVRCYKKGSFLEDVYTYNDFSHEGTKRGCEKKSDVTPDSDRPYLISEYNGHMYPTKAFDWEEHRMEHARRHANVLNDVAGQDNICGSFGWCMFDYNTHKDFGSGDRICYHGVMDMFRNPKQAAAVYAMQQDAYPVLELSSSMDIGEHPGCNRGDIYIYTNADSVKMYKNDVFIREFTAADSPYKNLAHGPILIDDYIGDLLEEKEKMPHEQAKAVKSLLNEVARVGLYGMSKPMYLKAGRMMLQYHMKMTDAVELYNKYIGDWGGESTVYRFEAIKDGEVVKTLTKAPMTGQHLEVEVSNNKLLETKTYDVAAVRFKMMDENGNQLVFANDPVRLTCSGQIELIGPEMVALQGGMFGCYVKSIGTEGKGELTLTLQDGTMVKVEFTVTCEKTDEI